MTTVAETMAWGRQNYTAGNLAGAEQAFRAALQADPGHAEAWCFLGIVRRGQGDIQEAAACYRESLRLYPDFVEAHNNLGNVLVLLGQIDEAVACFRNVLRLRPGFVEAHNNLGVALRNLGRLDEAIDCYSEALRLRPDYADAYNNLGDALSRSGRTQAALEYYEHAIRLRPNFAAAHNNLGAGYRQLGRLPEATKCYRDALLHQPQYPEAHYNLASVLAQQGQVDDALAEFREAVRMKPDYVEAYFHLAQALRARGRHDEALAVWQQLLQLPADNPDAHLGRALALLTLGDFARGWAEYEWRLQCKDFFRGPWSRPRWDGSDLAGRTILLHSEQGLGETIQFVRYSALVKSRGGTVILSCQKPLLRLLAGCSGVDQFIAADAAPPPYDVQAALPSLPALLGTTLATVPATMPYLFPDPTLVERWRRELAVYPGFKVGIAWQGNPQYRADRYRSFPLAEFEPLARVPGVQLFSLQKGTGSEQLANCKFPVVDLARRLDEESGPFLDTAAVMQSLDLVITVDTVIAHLAGALAVPTWLVLSAAGDYRWLLNRADSPWYPTMRLFRQQVWGGGDPVFTRVAQALAEMAADAPTGPLFVEIAPGELIDKITILEIKSERIRDPKKLANVRRELAVLEAARTQTVPTSEELTRLTADLHAANENLWRIEDDIRLCEQAGNFGPRFVELARSVYLTNDHRAALKRCINDLLGSEIIEEKGYR